MSNLTKSQQQQRLQNLLLAGNLYKSHKIHKEMAKLNQVSASGFRTLQKGIAQQTNLITQQTNLITQQTNLMEQERLERKQREYREIAEKNRIKSVQQIVFVVSEELDNIIKKLKSSKKKNHLELYFKILSLNAELENNDISPNSFDTQIEKKEISNLIKNINSYYLSIKKKLSKAEVKDLDKITNILEVNEEEEIDKLNSTVLAKAEKMKKQKLKTIKDSLIGPCGNVLYFFPFDESRTKLCFQIAKLKIDQLKYKIDAPLRLEIEIADKSFYLNDRDESLKIWYNSFVRDLLKHYTLAEIVKIRSLTLDWNNKYKDGKAGVVGKFKSLFGKKKTKEDFWSEFKNKNKKIFDKIEKTLPKLIEKSYTHIKAGREKEHLKIKKLKNTIKKEQKEFNQIYKRHPFVKTIINSRA